MQNKIEKIYCYVDESGQDTKGKFFIVSVVVAKKDQDKLAEKLMFIEEKTGKTRKWSRERKEILIQYLSEIFKSKEFRNKIFYSLNRNTKAYKELTILTIAATINEVKTTEKYKANVFIDGLVKPEINRVGTGLRQIGVRTEKVQGARDESNPFIRLADAIAGLVGRNQKGSDYTQNLIDIGIKKKILKIL